MSQGTITPSLSPSTFHPDVAPEPAHERTGPDRRPKFPADNGFQAAVRNRVNAYFRETGLSERDCLGMYLKTLFILVWIGVSYALLMTTNTLLVAFPAAISLALAMAAVGFSIQHDGGHHAYSRREWINRLAARSLDMMGASSYLWNWKHVVFHHTYSNVPGQDTDIELGAAIRVCPQQKRRWFHRWQHLYLFPMYGVTAARWHLYGDFKEVATGQMGPHKIPRPKGKDLAVFVLGKLWSCGLFIVVPALFQPLWLVILFYLFVTWIMGVVMSVVFQLAHCVGEADFPDPNPETFRFDRPWAVHQVETTVDFARDNRVLSWWLGGLNFQIEHHLMPQVCHIHYPALSKIVEATCAEYGVRYRAHRTFMGGMHAHYSWLREMGRPEPVAG